VFIPAWEYESILGITVPALVYIEPGSSFIKAVSTSRGILWCIPHNVPLK
jgi:hypothetical protein